MSYLCIIYVLSVLLTNPYIEKPVNWLELMTIGSVAAMCSFCGSMGFTESSGMVQASSLFIDGEDSSTYNTRAWWLVIMQIVSATGVIVIFSYGCSQARATPRDRTRKGFEESQAAIANVSSNDLLEVV